MTVDDGWEHLDLVLNLIGLTDLNLREAGILNSSVFYYFLKMMMMMVMICWWDEMWWLTSTSNNIQNQNLNEIEDGILDSEIDGLSISNF